MNSQGQHTANEKTKIRRLLEELESGGLMDAKELEKRTGFGRPMIVATMYAARDRGMVGFVPKREAAEQAERKTKRGTLYEFRSFESQCSCRDQEEVRDPWSEDLREFFESVCLKGTREFLAQLNVCSEVRRVTSA